ncbi:putative endonuclease [Rhodovulum iodosum]|uniref:UPF0102 protein Ga0609869_001629 n=1 Tax=Rhodovulum iodosum TaxID=68291 RepID=A0ABV3XSG1_9RHOB|nr:YraN family protein [Rhodovulum robiginosum]RSK30598.1 hypothetical protein EJA01_17685 [Rhodovulum robiginosum]
MSGTVAYHSGLAAEECVARQYQRQGGTIAARRWRGRGGEIDLVVEHRGVLIFVEVKKAKSFDRAAERVTPRQIERIVAAAGEYLAGAPLGLSSESRFDVALVDGQGQVEILPNAFPA